MSTDRTIYETTLRDASGAIVAGTGFKTHEYAHDAFAHAGYLSGVSPGHAGTIERVRIDAGGIRRTVMGSIVCGVYYSAGRLMPSVKSSKEAHDNGVDVKG